MFMLFLIVCIVIIFAVVLIKFRNRVFEYQEKIKQAKSRVRVKQNSYLKQMNNAVSMQHKSGSAMGNSTGGMFYGNIGSAQAYQIGVDLVNCLATSYEKAQYDLNDLVSEYNRYIGKFPNLILTMILKYEKEEYIDEVNLTDSTKIIGIDQSLV